MIAILLLAHALASESPLRVSVCDLRADPAAYDRKRVEVTALVSHGFENFALLGDDACTAKTTIWVEYGGKLASGTIYCCDVSAERHRNEPLVVENVVTSIIEDEHFNRFDKLIQEKPLSLVRAKLVGRFFSGELQTWPAGKSWAVTATSACRPCS